jgi:hypothetical protein
MVMQDRPDVERPELDSDAPMTPGQRWPEDRQW